MKALRRKLGRQQGAAAVEMALSMAVFTMVLLGTIEFGRLLWVWNAASEATRFGARLAVVCNVGEPNVVAHMRSRLPYLAAGHISVQYLPAGCTSADCQTVRVTLAGYTHQPIIPYVGLNVTIPPFQTTLPREFMQSAGNAVCAAPV